MVEEKDKVLEELKKSEALNRGILSVLKSQLAVINSHGNIVFTNESWQNFNKKRIKTSLIRGLVGENYLDVLFRSSTRKNANALKVLEGIYKILDKKQNFFQLEYHIDIAGSEKWFLLSISAYDEADLKLVIRQVDITDRVLFSRKIARSESRYKEILQRSNELIFSFDLEGKFIFLNNYFKKAFLFNEQELQAGNIFHILHKESFQSFKRLLRKVLAGKAVNVPETAFVTKNATKLYIEGNCTPLWEDDVQIGVQCFFRDITERKRMLDVLVKNERKYKNLVENINDAIVVRDLNGRVKFANKQFLDLIGLEEIELINLNLEEYIAPGWQAGLRRYYADYINGYEKEVSFVYEGVTSSGKRLWLEDRLSPVIEKNKMVAIQTIIRDITEIKQNEFEMKKLINELTNRNNEMMQFNYIVSHNLRSPIANIIGLTGLLSQTNINEKEKEKVLRFIREASIKMDDMLKDLSSILYTKSSINHKREKVYFHKLIQGILETLEKEILQSGCLLSVDIDENVNHMFTIKSYLESVFYNLISNAIKYRSVQRVLNLHISVIKKGNEIEIKVKDNGIGINLKDHGQQLFGLYKRFNFDTEGKGLGLHMTKTQVESLGGTISVESEPDKGTCFTIVFPTVYS